MSHFECPCVSPGFRGALPAQWVLLAKGLLGIELLLKDLQWLDGGDIQHPALLSASCIPELCWDRGVESSEKRPS